MSDAPAVASEPTTAAPSLESLDSSQFDHWRMTGEMPSSETSAAPKTPHAESSPAQPAEQADRTESLSPPASEPGKPSKPNAETRKVELQSEIQEALAERARLRADIEAERARLEQLRTPAPDAQPAASSPAPARPLMETIQSPDIDRAPLSDAEFFAQYPDATLVDLQRYVTRYEMLSDRRTQGVQQEWQTLTQTYQSRVAEATKADPKFWDGVTFDPRIDVHPANRMPQGAEITAANVIAQEILTSEAPAPLLKYLNTHPEELNRLLASPHAGAVARAIGRIEASLSSTAPQPAPAGDPVSLAPKPTPDLIGKKPAQPADELADAIKSGDFARYKELTDRKELSRTA